MWLLSTPEGQRGFFHHEWTKGGDPWVRVSVAAPDNPRISTAFLAEEREKLGEQRFRQEYLCEFEDSVSGVFDSELVDRAITDEVKPLVL